MSPTRKQASALLAGALITASAAYAVGTQTGGGDALAGTTSSSSSAGTAAVFVHDRRGDRSRGLSTLADTLGVTAAKLRAALDDLRDEQPEPTRIDLDARLADELGISEAKVESALRASRPERGERRDPERRRKAFGSARPGRGPFGGDVAALAKAMGVEADALEAAFEKIHDEMEAQHASRRAAFAKALAAKLDLDAAKVEDALAETPLGHHGGRRGGHGPR